MKPLVIYNPESPASLAAAAIYDAAFGPDGVELFEADRFKDLPVVDKRAVIILDYQYTTLMLEMFARYAARVEVYSNDDDYLRDLWAMRMKHGIQVRGYPNERTKGINSIPGMAWETLKSIGCLKGSAPPILKYFEAWLEAETFTSGARESRDPLAFFIVSGQQTVTQYASYLKASPKTLAKWMDAGTIMYNKHDRDVAAVAVLNRRLVKIAGNYHPVCGATPALARDVAEFIARNTGVGLAYYDNQFARVFVLVCRDGSEDARHWLLQYNGEGDEHVATFSVGRDHALARS